MNKQVKALALCLACLPAAAAWGQTYSKTETIQYYDDTSLWVLGQAARTTTNGVETSETTYGWKAMPTVTEQFGKVVQTLTYDTTSLVSTGQLGTLKTVKDGNNNITTVSSWKLGIPQRIDFADTTYLRAEVNANGWLNWTEDENRSRTCYTYDGMGRLASMTYSSETATNLCDESAWLRTTYTWEYRDLVEHGLPAGHWLRREHTGNHRRNTFYDAFWRPMLVHYYDGANVDATLQTTGFVYDRDGRVTFASYPVNTREKGTTGTWTDYDALGRVTSVTQDSELGALTTLTEYLSGFKVKVTSPKLQATTTSFQTYDTPTTDWPVAIEQPESARTEIARDAFGKVLTITRHSVDNTAWQRRYYVYNDFQELCKSTETETGTTAYGYDNAGNLSWSAAGLSWSPPGPCEHTKSGVATRRVDRTYDSRNRLATLSFPDGRGNQAWTYTSTGKVKDVSTNNSLGSDTAVVSYLYNRRGLMTRETLVTPDVNWPYTYQYNSNGHLSAAVWHGLTVDYAPNGIGQPTQAGGYATGVQYYPNGAVKQFTYGNGIVHTMTQNARQLPARSVDGSLLDLSYAYDKNANVASITDATAGARQSRSMTYDNLDRLLTASGTSFGTATYTYNALDNLTSLNVSAGNKPRNYAYVYDTGMRLTNITNGAGGATVVGLSYDVQGNLSNKNGLVHSFDFGNRLREVAGKGTYWYDGHGRRVRDTVNGVSKHSQYLASGQLAFTADSRSNEVREYIYLGDDMVAIRERDAATNIYTTRYQHSDGLGSALVETDANQAVLLRSEYEPYGSLTNRAEKDGPGFTGHVQDATTGLTYMQQRYYDPQIGRFLSVDPVTAYESPGANFNRYAYARNNSYRFVDPDGRESADLSYRGVAAIQSNQANLTETQTSVALLATVAIFAAPFAPEAAALLGRLLVREAVSEVKTSPQQRGRDSERRVLDDMGQTKNTDVVQTSKGRTIPDFQNSKQVGEIKDTVRVSDTRQLQAQREHAQATGREHVVVTGQRTQVSSTVGNRGTTIVRREDLGPKGGSE